MSELDRVTRLFEILDYPVPTVPQLDEIDSIEAGVNGTRAQLEAALKKIELRYKDDFLVGKIPNDTDYFNTDLAFIPTINDYNYRFFKIKRLQRIHSERFTILSDLFPNKEGVILEDGGIKRVYRVVNKRIKNARIDEQYFHHCPDLSRARLICDDLAILYEAHSELIDKMPYQQIGSTNHYSASVQADRRHKTPFRGLLTNWCNKFSKDEFDRRMSTEVQLVTRRVYLTMLLNHPFEVTQTIRYQDKKMQDYVHSLMLKASIMDFREHFVE